MELTLSFWNWLLAFSPVLVVVVLMLVFRWGGSRAGGLGWFLAVLAAVLFFGARFDLLAYSQVKAVLLSLDVLYIIWAALLLFNIAREAGAIRMIGRALPGLTGDRVMQSLLIGWLMVSFLQGTGGFGVPVAVCAPLLVGLGFSPVQAVAMAAIGHGWAVTYGSLASSFQTLIAVTGLPGEVLAPFTALLLGISAPVAGLLVALIGNGWKGLKRAVLPVLVIGSVMGAAQYLLATNGLWTLGATGGAIAGLLVGLILVRLPAYRAKPETEAVEPPAVEDEGKSLWLSLLAYGLLVVLAFSVNLIPSVDNFLSQVKLTMNFPELETALGWVTAAGSGREINIFGHPGAILLYTSIISFIIYRKVGYIQKGALNGILGRVVKSGVNSSLGILAMVGLASVMLHSGMTYLLAEGLSMGFGPKVFPLVSPFIGALGAFITGSNNNSNVLFAALQMNTAELLHLDVLLILAAQTAGGALGSVLAPAKVIVGCSTVGLAGREGEVMRKLLGYGGVAVGVVALAAFIINLVI
ncbi:MAG TPA: L-lactate permease [Anaerolineaceae bacterium]|nr:L-lactate permease [Anaerolineaceae bacterium]